MLEAIAMKLYCYIIIKYKITQDEHELIAKRLVSLKKERTPSASRHEIEKNLWILRGGKGVQIAPLPLKRRKQRHEAEECCSLYLYKR